jgi:hypothetical protein
MRLEESVFFVSVPARVLQRGGSAAESNRRTSLWEVEEALGRLQRGTKAAITDRRSQRATVRATGGWRPRITPGKEAATLVTTCAESATTAEV